MPSATHADFEFGDLTVRYQTDPATGRVGLLMFPTALKSDLAERRTTLRGERFIDVLPGDDPWPAAGIDPISQVKILGDAYSGGFATGHTMRNSPSAEGFRMDGQRSENGVVNTTLRNDRGHRIEHRLSWREGDAALGVEMEFFNDSEKPVTLEMLASFSLGGITPFAADDAAGRLRVHRFRSVWAAEGRLETRSIEELHLERSWSGSGVFSERFGQTGTMPVRKWFPFVAVEDTAAGVVWGAQLAWAGSWQMEIYRQHDELAISGGLADRESGHWMKTLAPGESLVAPPATVSCVRGSLDDLCDRLTAMQDAAVNAQPAVEQDLPVIFNEFCTTWGDPSHDNLIRIADRIQGTGVRYLVIDAGWYRSPDSSVWDGTHGDWVPGEVLFPHGLEATAAAIRERGLIPGIWFEMETVGEKSTAFSFVDHMLRRDGFPVTVRGRHFWDLNDPWVVDYLTNKVIGLLERCGFGYLKVDYNETLGLGCDDPDSLGEGLRKQVLASYRFFEKIRERLPHLVIENCSSGGHRLEPSMLARTAMSSFSDAHELPEIPIIAANLHRPYDGLAIIDCLMNMPLLYWATEESGDPKFRDMAMRHTHTTLTNFIREDDSVFHSFRFDPLTGAPTHGDNFCGRAVDSHWARGTAWAMYGFALGYRHTGEERFLDASLRVARRFVALLDDELVPMWDFRLDGESPQIRDASAASIAVCALQQLAKFGMADHSMITAKNALLARICSDDYLEASPAIRGIQKKGEVGDGVGNAKYAYTSWGDYYLMEGVARELGHDINWW